MRFAFLIILLLQCLVARSVLAAPSPSKDQAPAIVLNPGMDGRWLGRSLEFFQADGASASDILERKEGGFRVKKMVPSFGYTDKQYWARAVFRNNTDQVQTYYLVFFGPFEWVDLFQKTDGILEKRTQGMFLDLNQSIAFRFPTFRVELPPGDSTLLFTQKVVAPHYPLRIYSEANFEKFQYREHLMIAFVFGIGFLFFLMALFVLIRRPSRTQVYFSLSFIFYMLFSLFVTGSARPLLLIAQDALDLNLTGLESFIYRNWILWWGGTEFFVLLFGWHILQLQQTATKLVRYIYYFGLISSFSLGALSYVDPVLTINAFAMPFHGLVLMFASISWYRYLNGYAPAKNYAIAWTLYGIMLTVQMLYFFGIMGPSFITSWGLVIGTLLQFFFFGLSIFDQQDYIERQLRAQKEEEKKKVEVAHKQLESNFEILKKFSDTLRVYVSPSIQMEVAMGRNPLDYKPRYGNRIISFMDMRNYAGFAEKRPLAETHSILNECFDRIMSPVFEYQGEVDKLIGDAVMAVFNENAAKNCLEATLAARRNLSEHNRKLVERGVPPIKFGTGIALGEVLTANYGNMQKMDRTVVGDAVNVASRIESATKFYQTDVMASEEFVAALKDYECVRPLNTMLLKGRTTPTRVYEIFGHNSDAIITYKLSTRDRLNQVMELKNNGYYGDCLQILDEMIQACPEHTYKPGIIMDPTLIVIREAILRLANEAKGD